MDKPRKIILKDAVFSSVSLQIKSPVLTAIKLTCNFDQLIADQLGVKGIVYDANGGIAEDFWSADFAHEYYGARVDISPKQGRIETGKISNGLGFSALLVDGFKVGRHKDDNALRMTVDVLREDPRGEVVALAHDIRRDEFDVAITPAPKKESEEAQHQVSLFSKRGPKGKEDAEGVEE